jgi:hypothetical protein
MWNPFSTIKKGYDKAMTAMILGVVRHALTTFGGALVARGTLGESDLELAVGSIMTLLGIAASLLNKKGQT